MEIADIYIYIKINSCSCLWVCVREGRRLSTSPANYVKSVLPSELLLFVFIFLIHGRVKIYENRVHTFSLFLLESHSQLFLKKIFHEYCSSAQRVSIWTNGLA